MGDTEVVDIATGSPREALTLAAYTSPREVYEEEILPAFGRHWREKTGQDVRFRTSYLGSGAQVCAILTGYEADVVALSHEGDLDKLAGVGLITHDWRRMPARGVVSTSVVALAVRAGNPKGIRDWADLRRPGLAVVTPDPFSSGGRRWNVNAMYGAALRGHAGISRRNPEEAQRFLRDVFRNVTVMDNGARESVATFESGIGDVAITYESEVFLGGRRARHTSSSSRAPRCSSRARSRSWTGTRTCTACARPHGPSWTSCGRRRRSGRSPAAASGRWTGKWRASSPPATRPSRTSGRF